MPIHEIIDGLNALGMYDLLKANSFTMQKLFVSQPVSLTADYILNYFQTRLFPEGTNRQGEEKQILVYWVHFIEMMEGN